MDELYNVAKVTTALQAIAEKYPTINSFITQFDWVTWQKRLEASTNLDNDLYGGPTFTLMKLLAAASLEEQHPELPRVGTPIIMNLENWLDLFPELKSDDKFSGKLKNPDRDNFMSTLSELLLAAHLKRSGYTVLFEQKFINPNRKGKPDVDITITETTGESFHLEVYSPYLPAGEGFLGLDDANETLSKKAAFKMDDKFGQGQISGLWGKVLLAVDTQKVDMLSIKERLSGKPNDDLYLDMANYLPQAVDGYLFFRGNVSAQHSFVFEKLILKK